MSSQADPRPIKASDKNEAAGAADLVEVALWPDHARSLSGSAGRDEVGDEVRVDRRALSIKS
jgi:hypothetical protein